MLRLDAKLSFSRRQLKLWSESIPAFSVLFLTIVNPSTSVPVFYSGALKTIQWITRACKLTMNFHLVCNYQVCFISKPTEYHRSNQSQNPNNFRSIVVVLIIVHESSIVRLCWSPIVWFTNPQHIEIIAVLKQLILINTYPIITQVLLKNDTRKKELHFFVLFVQNVEISELPGSTWQHC